MEIIMLLILSGLDFHFNEWKVTRFLWLCGQHGYKQLNKQLEEKNKDKEE